MVGLEAPVISVTHGITAMKADDFTTPQDGVALLKTTHRATVGAEVWVSFDFHWNSFLG
jgi:hypothetical protein